VEQDSWCPSFRCIFATVRENRTGVSRYSQGLDAESLNKTLGGSAETAIKRLYGLVYRAIKRAATGPVHGGAARPEASPVAISASGQTSSNCRSTPWASVIANKCSGTSLLSAPIAAFKARRWAEIQAYRAGWGRGVLPPAEPKARIPARYPRLEEGLGQGLRCHHCPQNVTASPRHLRFCGAARACEVPLMHH
jgi:hypothetical protein